MSRSFDSKGAAERWARAQEREIDLGRSGGRSFVAGTVADLIERYNREVGARRPFGRTKEFSLRKLQEMLGDVKLSELNSNHVVRFAQQRESQGAGPVTIGIDLSYLGTVLRTMRALTQLNVSDEPVKEAQARLRIVDMIAKSRERDRRPTQTELDKLVAYFRNGGSTLPMGDLIEFAVASGMRREEICRLRWHDLNARWQTIIIRDRKHPRATKGNDEKVPRLKVTGYDALEIIQRQPKNGELIFPVNPDTISSIFPRGCNALGIKGLRFHDLRHEAASRMFEAGMAIEQVALVTGHKDWKTLRRYTQLKPEEIVRSVRDLVRPEAVMGMKRALRRAPGSHLRSRPSAPHHRGKAS
jgi:integrase